MDFWRHNCCISGIKRDRNETDMEDIGNKETGRIESGGGLDARDAWCNYSYIFFFIPL